LISTTGRGKKQEGEEGQAVKAGEEARKFIIRKIEIFDALWEEENWEMEWATADNKASLATPS